jgi:hypothetical protein
MWIFTPFGFFSATAYEGDEHTTEPEIQIRGRAKADLQNLIKKYFVKTDDERIFEWKGRDYPYRVIVTQQRWAAISARMAQDIDYSNFKDQVKKVQGENRAHHYMSVWSLMNGLEFKMKDAARIRKADLKKWAKQKKLMGTKAVQGLFGTLPSLSGGRDDDGGGAFPDRLTDAELDYPSLFVGNYMHGRPPKKKSKAKKKAGGTK